MSQPLSGHPSWDQLDSNPNPLSDPNSNRGPLSNPLLPSNGRVNHGQYNYSNMAGFNHTPTPMAQPEAQDQHVDTRLMDVADQGNGGLGFPQGPNPPAANRHPRCGANCGPLDAGPLAGL
ncbi:hypothetical protein PtA15_6A65 [Puccinia triticina]|uniref:Uncharacterized protein n=1 Tax=Puccinia triticina TaxID=208348 RepID=A0ABY7CRT8_9BASI|nr:uncharacterized protein PtA15_6A65 [Puccinia triticina]WAQ85437.1 hypothetical protein PtA15_6A65 [Puccinia triticina]